MFRAWHAAGARTRWDQLNWTFLIFADVSLDVGRNGLVLLGPEFRTKVRICDVSEVSSPQGRIV